MTDVIYKYPLEVTDEQIVWMPAGAKIMCAQMQGEVVTLWAQVELNAVPSKRRIVIVGTGHIIPAGTGSYIGTVQMVGEYSGLVFHVYEGAAA